MATTRRSGFTVRHSFGSSDQTTVQLETIALAIVWAERAARRGGMVTIYRNSTCRAVIQWEGRVLAFDRRMRRELSPFRKEVRL